MTKHIRLSIVAACVLFASSAAAADVSVAEDVKQSRVFAPAMSLSYVPFGMIDPSGKPAGFDVELAHEVADLVDAELKIQTVTFPNQIPGLVSGRLKVAWSTFSVTAERLKQVDFVGYLQAGSVAGVLPANADKWKESLCGATVAVAQGSSGDFVVDKLNKNCADEGKPEIKKTIYPDQRQEIQATLTGRVDAWLDDSTVVGNFQQQGKGQLVVTGPNYYPLPLAMAVAKGDTETAEMLRSALQALIENGKYGELLKNYNLQDSAIKRAVIYTSADQVPDK
ncbi:ABC transporter substrate-binding protein [Rhizobium leguminosarum]